LIPLRLRKSIQQSWNHHLQRRIVEFISATNRVRNTLHATHPQATGSQIQEGVNGKSQLAAPRIADPVIQYMMKKQRPATTIL